MLKRQVHIGISDLKSLLFAIKRHKGIDFTDYALSSLKWRVENFMERFHFENTDELLHKLIKDDDYFYQLFLKDILVDTTELFRDPEFWIELKKTILFRLKKHEQINILLPECNSGEELHSLLILLKNEELIDKANICVTSLSKLNVERILQALLENKKMETNTANFEKVYENGKITDFFDDKGRVFKLKPELMNNVKVKEHNLLNDKTESKFHLIIYRNKTIYYNPQLKNKALNLLKEQLITGGYIALGVKENLEYPGYEQEFSLASDSEKIYKKTI